jgi:hypothetical protein
MIKCISPERRASHTFLYAFLENLDIIFRFNSYFGNFYYLRVVRYALEAFYQLRGILNININDYIMNNNIFIKFSLFV